VEELQEAELLAEMAEAELKEAQATWAWARKQTWTRLLILLVKRDQNSFQMISLSQLPVKTGISGKKYRWNWYLMTTSRFVDVTYKEMPKQGDQTGNEKTIPIKGKSEAGNFQKG